MSKPFKASDVFKPGTIPGTTYVSRQSDGHLSYEQRLHEALETPGFLTSIVGPSTSGKTVLCEKVIPRDQMVLLSSTNFRNEDDFWTVIARQLGLPTEMEAGDEPVNVHPEIKGTPGPSTSQSWSKDRVIDVCLSRNLIVVLDDFHCIAKERQMRIAHQLRDAIAHEMKVVVISLPHRSDESIRENPDFSGRISVIHVEPWSSSDLAQIPTKGFQTLGVEISADMAMRLAEESLASPQLAQNICLVLARVIGVDNSSQVDAIHSNESLVDAFRRTTLNTPYGDVVKIIQAGPPRRGQDRLRYRMGDNSVDIYTLILAAMAKDPPRFTMSMEGLHEKIEDIVRGSGRLNRNKIREAMRQIQTLLKERGCLYQVIEWTYEELHVLDPKFLFYLRWFPQFSFYTQG